MRWTMARPHHRAAPKVRGARTACTSTSGRPRWAMAPVAPCWSTSTAVVSTMAPAATPSTTAARSAVAATWWWSPSTIA
ncbi:hypothetical protein G6F23_015891 [Rhizopus arrhizus]|nr:hypothetical protein G6F23_015891 [Rhizopus arrhizus]